MERCRVIVRSGVGFDNVDLAEAGRRGIYVCNVPDYGVDEVADHAIGMMLALNRGLLLADRRLRDSLSPWDYTATRPVHRLAGATMGVVGLGRIGTATALRAKALKMRVLACDPYIASGVDKAVGVQMAELDELLAASDVVSLHVPLTDDTRHLIDARALGLMKPAAVLVNTARGAVVDVDALAAALAERRIAGAGIDVLPVEPPGADSALIRLWREEADPPINLILTPHSAFYSEQGLAEMRVKGAREIGRVLRGELPRNCVNQGFMRHSG
jgi:D-3-phosphoglycerate dehydrogenase/C-terminal binding protein